MRLPVAKVLTVVLAMVLVFSSAAPVMAAKARGNATVVKSGGKHKKHKHRKHIKEVTHVKRVKHVKHARHKKKTAKA